MTELIIFGAVAAACLALGFFMYRSMKETGGCGCCGHTNNPEHEHGEHCDHEHHEHCDCEHKK
jgi:hypothetical protein